MELSSPVAVHLAALDLLSHNRLACRPDLALLLELAYRAQQEKDLEELSYLGKFCARTFGIMRRIGRNGEGYDRLSAELSANLEKVRSLLRSLLSTKPGNPAEEFAVRYLALTPESVQNLLALMHDLSWHKNWSIDHPGESPWQSPTS